MKSLFALSLTVLIAACASPGASVGSSGTPVFALSSPGLEDGARLSLRHAGNLASNANCVGQNVSPPLAWRNVPPGTRSLAMLVHDQEGRSGLGVAHWVAYGIPVATAGFAENEIAAPSGKYVGGKSTLNLGSYMGPCPPAGTGEHHYVFTLIATDLDPGALPVGLAMSELLDRLNGRTKGASSIVLRYGRP